MTDVITMLDLIEPPHGWPTLAEDDPLLLSIAERGVITPIIVQSQGRKWAVVDGKRRLAALKQLDRYEFPAHIRAQNDADPGLDAAVANIVRRPSTRSATIRVMRDTLPGQGPARIAAALGIEPRRARIYLRMLGIDDTVLRTLERHERITESLDGSPMPLPDDRELLTIASAPPDRQQAVARDELCADEPDEEFRPNWHSAYWRCKASAIRKADAWFNADAPDCAINWQEDLFAQPGDPDATTTTDIAAFIDLQRQALAATFALRRPKKSWVLADWSSIGQTPVIPDHLLTLSMIMKPQDLTDAGRDTIVAAVAESGPRLGQVIAYRCQPAGLGAKALAAAKAADPPPSDDDDDDGEAAIDEEPADEPPAPPPQPVADITPLTNTGRDLVRARKQEALIHAIDAMAEPINWRHIAALLVLSYRANNVHVSTAGLRTDLVPERHLVTPAGLIDLPPDDELLHLVKARLQYVLSVGDPEGSYPIRSGQVAEWIGHALRADDYLPRFDDATFLKEVRGEDLRNAAAAGDFGKLPTKVTDLRKAITDRLPDYRPPGATFGAPGPKPAAVMQALRERREG